MPAYRSEPGVAPESRTETFLALKLNIDNWRWAGVPFYIRTGKRLAQRHTEITIQFKRTPFEIFRNAPVHNHTNQLVMQIQPVEGISLSFGAKVPGPVLRVGSVDMSFEYTKYFGADAYTGYEVLLYECMIGDATLFQRADMVEAGWSIVDPVLDVWQALPPRRFPNYPVRHMGTGGVRRIAGPRRPAVEENRTMILAGDIGGTRTRLAAFETEGSKLKCVVEKTYPSQEHGGLAEIVAEFVKTEGIPVHSACFGVAGPVRGGRSKISNLPWTIDSRELAHAAQAGFGGPDQRSRSLCLWRGCARIERPGHAECRIGRRGRKSRSDLGPHRTGCGRSLLGWLPASSFRLRRRTHGFRAHGTIWKSNCSATF